MQTAVGIAAALLSATLCVRADDLLRELQRRNATEGWELIRLRSNFAEVVKFDDVPEAPKNPRDSSLAWFSSDGRFVAWNIHRIREHRLEGCRNPVVVESVDGTALWQVPGSFVTIGALGVSADGRRLAFDATYKPPGTGSLANKGRWITGLFQVDSKNRAVARVSESCGTTSISWSQDGGSFVYDCDGHVLIFDVASGKSRAIASGSAPSWSPDGRWIAFRSGDGRAAAIDPITQKAKLFMDGRRIIWGIHWSPDSQYVMAAESVGFWSVLRHLNLFLDLEDPPYYMLIYRVSDGASLERFWFPFQGSNDRGFYWISDSTAFLKTAELPPVVKPCP